MEITLTSVFVFLVFIVVVELLIIFYLKAKLNDIIMENENINIKLQEAKSELYQNDLETRGIIAELERNIKE